MAKHKDDFKDAPSIWNDVVLTALRYLIGAVIKVLTLGFCGSSLFQKPDSAAQNIVKEAAVALIDSERAMMPQRSGS